MRKLVFLLSVLASLSFAGIEASLGFGPYHGIVGVGYTMMDDHFSANIHLSNFSTDYDFFGGMGVAYRFSGLSGAYVFHSSDWMTGEVEGFRIRLEDGEFADVEETCRRFDYWRLVFGLGFQYLIQSIWEPMLKLGSSSLLEMAATIQILTSFMADSIMINLFSPWV